MQQFVITSYSIHYTKLYDGVGINQAYFIWCKPDNQFSVLIFHNSVPFNSRSLKRHCLIIEAII